MLETILLSLLAEISCIIILALIFRATGKRLPQWIGPKWIVDRINDMIDGDPKRLDRVVKRWQASSR